MPRPPQKVLVAEDHPKTRQLIRGYLEAGGFQVEDVEDGHAALRKARQEVFDLALLDLMLPGLDGLSVCRELRREGELPVILVTARTAEDERVRGLDLGADDYVTKPFSPRELMARVRAVLRRTGGDPGSSRLEVAEVSLDRDVRKVLRDGEAVELTPREFDLLDCLMSRPGRVFTRAELVERVLGILYDGTPRTIDAHVTNLRRKLEPEPSRPRYVLTAYGVGYSFGDGTVDRDE